MKHHTLAILACSLFLSHGLASGGETPNAPAARSYQAQWIWANVQQPKPFQFVRFRKTVELASRPAKATAYITADTFYRLWINGELAMHGPARTPHGTATIDPVDVARYLTAGKNTLMVEVFHAISMAEALSQAPGLLCEVEAEENGKPQVITATDGTWEASEITAWSRESLRFSFQRGWMEQIDACQILEEKPQPAVVLGKAGMKPWQELRMRDVPLPAPLLPMPPNEALTVQRGDGVAGAIAPRKHYEPDLDWDRRSQWFRRLQTERLSPDISAVTNPSGVTRWGSGDTVLNGDGSSVSYDFGEGYVGFPGFEVTGRAGQVLELVWNEQLSSEGDVRPRAQTGNNAIRYVLHDGRQRFVAFMPQFVRFLRVVQRGAGELTLHRLSVTEFRFAAEQKGSFRCSDNQFNLIYDAARRTAMLVTLDAYMDCPHRERNAMYGMEAYSTELALYPMFGDTSVSRRSILNGADSVNAPEHVGPPGLVQCAYPMQLSSINSLIPIGPMWWVLHMGLYERCSGDADLIRAMIPVMRANLAAVDTWRGRDDLIETSAIPSPFMFFDYADMRMADGISIALNATYVKTLEEAARLERLAGDATQADAFASLADKVRLALNRHCPGELFYPDVLLRDEKNGLVPSKEACETTQYYAMWANVAPPDRIQRLWQAMRDDFIPTPRKKVQPIQGLTRGGLYCYFARQGGSARLGDYSAMLRDMKALFMPMVESPPGTLWEDVMGDIALCHGIACQIGGTLTEEVLGIRFGFPLRIAPHNCGSLQWCNGYITTPKGPVAVDWNCRKDRYELRASIPKGIGGEVALPPEAKTLWQSAATTTPWHDTIHIEQSATIIVTPGRVTVEK